MKIKPFPISQNIYNRRVVLLYGTSSEINAAIKRRCPDDDPAELDATVVGRYYPYADKEGRETDYICVVKLKDRLLETQYLAHEVLHHVCHTLRAIKVPLNRRTEEVYTYYQDFVFGQCLRAMRGGAA